MKHLDKLRDEKAKDYPFVYEIKYMNADTSRLSGAEYLVHGYKAGWTDSQAEMTKVVELMREALKICASPYSSEYKERVAEQALAKLRELEGEG